MKIFIGCSKQKLHDGQPHPASELYCSDIFQKSLRYARTLTEDENIFVLSAKYGVLKLDQQISTYDKTLVRMSKREREEWSKMVKLQFPRYSIHPTDAVIFLAGRYYTEHLIDYFRVAKAPMGNLKMGYRENWLKTRLEVKK